MRNAGPHRQAPPIPMKKTRGAEGREQELGYLKDSDVHGVEDENKVKSVKDDFKNERGLYFVNIANKDGAE
eukprot:11809826-Heterocapsa_arctica.AAC.2